MAARGSLVKEEITKHLLEYYGDNAAIVDKVLRIRGDEGGEWVEIKVTLTAAKDSVMNSSEKGAAAPKSTIEKEEKLEVSMGNAPTPAEMSQLDDYIKQLEKMNMI